MTIAKADMEKFCRRGLGYFSTTSSDVENMIDACVDSAIQAFFMPSVLPGEKASHIWSFLYRADCIFTVAPYSTSTIGITGTAVTGVEAEINWPTYAANGCILVNDEMHQVASRTPTLDGEGNDTGLSYRLVLKKAVATTIPTGTSYQLVFIHYDIPPNFAGVYGPVTFAPGVGKGPVQQTSSANIETLHQNSGVTNGLPEFIGFDGQIKGDSADNLNTQPRIKIWPIPDKQYQLNFKYIQHSLGNDAASDGSSDPLEANTSSYLSLVPDYHADTIYAALSVRMAEMFAVGEINGARQYFVQRMQDSVYFDRTLQSSTVGDFIGYNGDSSDSRYGRQTSSLYKSDVTATKYSDPLGLGRLL